MLTQQKLKSLPLGDFLNFIKYPSFTEKSISILGLRWYTFIVDRSLTKLQIKYLLEEMFQVKILQINTLFLPRKTLRVRKALGRKPRYKKAYIKLKIGYKIENIFD